MNKEELIKKWKPVLSYTSPYIKPLPEEQWEKVAVALNEKEQELIGFTCDIELSKHILRQIRINAGEPLKEYDVGGKTYILIEKDVEHYKEEALRWEFRYKQEKNQNLDHEKDYFEIWKLIKEPDESVVGAVKRIIRERDKALGELEKIKS